MNDVSKNENSEIQQQLEQLDSVLEKAKHLLIIVHNNPDPDAIATAAALSYLVRSRMGISTSIAYGGSIGRAENRAMVHKLKIHMKQIGKINFAKYDRIALVDTQPGAGNNSLPPNQKCHIVIDHHPYRDKVKADLVIIKPGIGVSATILIEWLKQSGTEITADLATALSYAISSETQNLGRETSGRDIQAYLSVYVKSSVRKLAQITHPKLMHSYFVSLVKAVTHSSTFRNLICAHLGEVPAAEMVAEMADFLLRHERMGWSFCTGVFKGQLHLSVRSSNPRANAGKLIKKLVPDPNAVGGHDMIAGGHIVLENQKKKEIKDLEEKLQQEFALVMGYKNAEWKPLLSETEKPG